MSAEDRTTLVEVFTASATLNRRYSGMLLTNRGAAGAVTLTLPAGEKGIRIRARKVTAQTFTLARAGSDTITNSAGGSVTSLAVNVSVELQHDGTAWVVQDEVPAADDTVAAAQIADGAIDAAAKIGAGVVTQAKITFTGGKKGTFAGAAGAGAITLTGAVAGDRVVAVYKFGDVSDNLTVATGTVTTQPNALFEATITVNDQIQQASATDLSDNKYVVELAPAAA